MSEFESSKPCIFVSVPWKTPLYDTRFHENAFVKHGKSMQDAVGYWTQFEAQETGKYLKLDGKLSLVCHTIISKMEENMKCDVRSDEKWNRGANDLRTCLRKLAGEAFVLRELHDFNYERRRYMETRTSDQELIRSIIRVMEAEWENNMGRLGKEQHCSDWEPSMSHQEELSENFNKRHKVYLVEPKCPPTPATIFKFTSVSKVPDSVSQV